MEPKIVVSRSKPGTAETTTSARGGAGEGGKGKKKSIVTLLWDILQDCDEGSS